MQFRFLTLFALTANCPPDSHWDEWQIHISAQRQVTLTKVFIVFLSPSSRLILYKLRHHRFLPHRADFPRHKGKKNGGAIPPLPHMHSWHTV
jgi:hypothetical protein